MCDNPLGLFDLQTMQPLMESSPIQHIVFLAKYELVDNLEFIYGTITFDEFIDLLENKKILFNTRYVIRANDFQTDII